MPVRAAERTAERADVDRALRELKQIRSQVVGEPSCKKGGSGSG